MPVPVILGLPWLASVISGIASSLLVKMSEYLTKRVAVIAALIASWGAVFAALKAATIGATAGLVATLPAPVLEYGGAVVPGNLGTFLSVWGATEAAVVAYKFADRILQFKAHL